MDRETLKRLFDPFFTTKFTGRGLGLASVLGIMRTHKGDIEVESAVGKGTTFRAFFPVTTGQTQPSVERARGDLVGKGLVLVVDDDDNVRRTTARLIALHGFEVLEAGSGDEAKTIFAARPSEFAVVVVDLSMPGMSGRETVRELRAIRGDVPVVVMSGYDESDARWLAADGITTFLAKPFTVDELARRFGEVLVT
jgi:CheY-like chemotaxis protein